MNTRTIKIENDTYKKLKQIKAQTGIYVENLTHIALKNLIDTYNNPSKINPHDG
jgi:hypothetical protein